MEITVPSCVRLKKEKRIDRLKGGNNRMKARNDLICILSVLLMVVTLGTSGSCSSSSQQSEKIFLSDLQPLPSVNTSVQRPIGVAVVGSSSPEVTFTRYQKVVGYLSEKTGRPFELMMRPNYEEINDLIRTGVASLAFVCSGAYVEGQRQFGMQLLVAPEINGKTTCYSYIIVPSGSPTRSLADLKDTIFAGSYISDTGRLALSYSLLKKEGATLETFFHRYTYTYSDEKSIRAIAEFLFDGAAVNGIIYEDMVRTEPDTTRRTRIIELLGPYGISPVVVPPFLDGEIKEEIRSALLSADKDEKGREALQVLGVDRFVLIGDNAYDSVREMAKKVWWVQ